MMTDKQIRRILMVVLESKCGKDFMSRVQIRLYTKRCSADHTIRCKHVYNIYEGWDALEKYRANRTLDNARRVINSYANKIIKKFNEYQDKQFEIESKAAYKEIEHNKYDIQEIMEIINKATEVGRYRTTKTSIGRYSKAALIKAAYNKRNHGTRYSNSASLVIMAVMDYVDKVISERKLSNYFSA